MQKSEFEILMLAISGMRSDLTAQLQGFKNEMDERFKKVDERFDQIDKRFAQMDARFDQMDERFARMDERFDRMDARQNTAEHQLTAIRSQTADLVVRVTRLENHMEGPSH